MVPWYRNKEFQPQPVSYIPQREAEGGVSSDKLFQERKVPGLIGPDTGSNSQLNRSCQLSLSAGTEPCWLIFFSSTDLINVWCVSLGPHTVISSKYICPAFTEFPLCQVLCWWWGVTEGWTPGVGEGEEAQCSEGPYGPFTQEFGDSGGQLSKYFDNSPSPHVSYSERNFQRSTRRNKYT